MKQYSDYYRAVEGYLWNLEKFKTAKDNLDIERNDLRESLKAIAVPTAKYGNEPGGGGELNRTESETNQRIKMQSQINRLNKEISDIDKLVTKVDRALNSLSQEHKQVIEMKYFDRTDWFSIANKLHYSARWCQEMRDKAIKEMIYMMFGKQSSVQQRFSFYS